MNEPSPVRPPSAESDASAAPNEAPAAGGGLFIVTCDVTLSGDLSERLAKRADKVVLVTAQDAQAMSELGVALGADPDARALILYGAPAVAVACGCDAGRDVAASLAAWSRFAEAAIQLYRVFRSRVTLAEVGPSSPVAAAAAPLLGAVEDAMFGVGEPSELGRFVAELFQSRIEDLDELFGELQACSRAVAPFDEAVPRVPRERIAEELVLLRQFVENARRLGEAHQAENDQLRGVLLGVQGELQALQSQQAAERTRQERHERAQLGRIGELEARLLAADQAAVAVDGRHAQRAGVQERRIAELEADLLRARQAASEATARNDQLAHAHAAETEKWQGQLAAARREVEETRKREEGQRKAAAAAEEAAQKAKARLSAAEDDAEKLKARAGLLEEHVRLSGETLGGMLTSSQETAAALAAATARVAALEAAAAEAERRQMLAALGNIARQPVRSNGALETVAFPDWAGSQPTSPGTPDTSSTGTA